MRNFQCPNCSAQLSFDDSNRDFAFCQYCGSKIMLDDYRSAHRVIDEARIHESETDRLIRMRELDIEEKEQERFRKNRASAFKIALCFVAIGAISQLIVPYNLLGIFAIVGGAWIALFTVINSDSQKAKLEEKRNTRSGMIKLTSAAAKYTSQNYKTMQSIYSSLGFTQITLVNLNDLRMGLLKKPGLVEKVTISGSEPHEGKWYNPNAEVVITYHGFIEG